MELVICGSIMNRNKLLYLECLGFIACIILILLNVDKWVIISGLIILESTWLIVYITTTLKINQFIETISNSLDNTINHDFSEFELYDDTAEAKLQHKLKRLYTALEQTKSESEQQKKSLKTLITDISHQVKAPITNIKLYSELLKRNDLSVEEHEQFFSMLVLQVDKLDFLIQSLIKMSRLENDVIKLNIQQSSLDKMILKSIQDVFSQSEDKQIEIKLTGNRNLEAQFDSKWTQEALSNILDNAIKYSKKQTIITINISKNDFYAKISIKDQGIGIPNQSINNIFKRFERGQNVNDNNGIGVGLYLSREIINKQKGFITVKSTIDIGSIFTIYLPL